MLNAAYADTLGPYKSPSSMEQRKILRLDNSFNNNVKRRRKPGKNINEEKTQFPLIPVREQLHSKTERANNSLSTLESNSAAAQYNVLAKRYGLKKQHQQQSHRDPKSVDLSANTSSFQQQVKQEMQLLDISIQKNLIQYKQMNAQTTAAVDDVDKKMSINSDIPPAIINKYDSQEQLQLHAAKQSAIISQQAPPYSQLGIQSILPVNGKTKQSSGCVEIVQGRDKDLRNYCNSFNLIQKQDMLISSRLQNSHQSNGHNQDAFQKKKSHQLSQFNPSSPKANKKQIIELKRQTFVQNRTQANIKVNDRRKSSAQKPDSHVGAGHGHQQSTRPPSSSDYIHDFDRTHPEVDSNQVLKTADVLPLISHEGSQNLHKSSNSSKTSQAMGNIDNANGMVIIPLKQKQLVPPNYSAKVLENQITTKLQLERHQNDSLVATETSFKNKLSGFAQADNRAKAERQLSENWRETTAQDSKSLKKSSQKHISTDVDTKSPYAERSNNPKYSNLRTLDTQQNNEASPAKLPNLPGSRQSSQNEKVKMTNSHTKIMTLHQSRKSNNSSQEAMRKSGNLSVDIYSQKLGTRKSDTKQHATYSKGFNSRMSANQQPLLRQSGTNSRSHQNSKQKLDQHSLTSNSLNHRQKVYEKTSDGAFNSSTKSPVLPLTNNKNSSQQQKKNSKSIQNLTVMKKGTDQMAKITNNVQTPFETPSSHGGHKYEKEINNVHQQRHTEPKGLKNFIPNSQEGQMIENANVLLIYEDLNVRDLARSSDLLNKKQFQNLRNPAAFINQGTAVNKAPSRTNKAILVTEMNENCANQEAGSSLSVLNHNQSLSKLHQRNNITKNAIAVYTQQMSPTKQNNTMDNSLDRQNSSSKLVHQAKVLNQRYANDLKLLQMSRENHMKKVKQDFQEVKKPLVKNQTNLIPKRSKPFQQVPWNDESGNQKEKIQDLLLQAYQNRSKSKLKQQQNVAQPDIMAVNSIIEMPQKQAEKLKPVVEEIAQNQKSGPWQDKHVNDTFTAASIKVRKTNPNMNQIKQSMPSPQSHKRNIAIVDSINEQITMSQIQAALTTTPLGVLHNKPNNMMSKLKPEPKKQQQDITPKSNLPLYIERASKASKARKFDIQRKQQLAKNIEKAQNNCLIGRRGSEQVTQEAKTKHLLKQMDSSTTVGKVDIIDSRAATPSINDQTPLVFGGAKKQAVVAKRYSLQDFELLGVLGRGSFGQVKLVKHRITGNLFAMKQIQKERIQGDKHMQHIKNEKQILKDLTDEVALAAKNNCTEFSFFVNFEESLQDEECLYLLLEYLPGGELLKQIRVNLSLTMDQSLFYLAEILVAIQQLHQKNIIYRDLKPENILLDREGHIKLIDFGFSKRLSDLRKDRVSTNCGTPAYAAPEVLIGAGYNYKADIWSFGILICEMLGGFTPFGSQAMEIGVAQDGYVADSPGHGYSSMPPHKILEIVQTGRITLPKNLTPTTRDLVRKILVADPNGRVEIREIMQHQFFEGIDWHQVERKLADPPHIPDQTLHNLQLQKQKSDNYATESGNQNPNAMSPKSKRAYQSNKILGDYHLSKLNSVFQNF